MKKKFISSICAMAMLTASVAGLTGVTAGAEEKDLYVLTDNVFTDADIAYYADAGVTLKTLDTDAEYWWASGVNGDVLKYDSYNGIKNADGESLGLSLTDGNITFATQTTQPHYHRNNTYSSWTGGASTAKFDLKDTFVIEKIDLFEKIHDANAKIGNITVTAGTDADNMQEVYKGTATADSAMTSIELATPVEARYINITIARGKYKYGIDEIVIFGTAPDGANQYKISKAVAKAEKYEENKDFYTEESYASVNTFLNILRNANPAALSEAQTDTYISNLENAIANLAVTDGYYTLSGNTWQDVEKTDFYGVWEPELDLVTIDNDSTYKWIALDGNTPEVIKFDPNFVSMTDGNIDTVSMNIDGVQQHYSTWTNYDATWPGVIDFDLGAVYPANRVDLVLDRNGSDAEKERQHMAWLKVYTSMDGVNYELAATKVGETDNVIKSIDGTHDFNLQTVKFPVTNARYVRVVAETSGSQIRFMEAAVMGFDSKTKGVTDAMKAADEYLEYANCYTADSIAELRHAYENASYITDDDTLAEMNEAINDIKLALSRLALEYPRLVYSGNKWAENDLKNYQIYDPNLTELKNAGNKASYTWAEGSSPNGMNDSACTKLTGGFIHQFNGSYAADSKWESALPGIAVFDLGTTAIIDRVDVFNHHEQYKAMKDVTISVSMDGEKFTDIKTVPAIGEKITEAGVQVMNLTTVEFPPEKARYVKVTCTEADYLVIMSEVVIFGIGANYIPLENAISEYTAISENENVVAFATEDSLNVLKDAIAAGEKIVEEHNATEEEIAAAVNTIEAAFDAIEYTETVGILTNNLKTDADKAMYPGYDNLFTGLTYSMTSSDTSSELLDATKAGSDVDFTKLINGTITNTASGNAFGRWGGDKVVTITVDAMKDVYFTGIDFYDLANIEKESKQGIDNISVAVSADGVDYTDVAFIDDPEDVLDANGNLITTSTDLHFRKFAGNFAPIQGRYMKIVTTTSNIQQVLAEMVVKGFVIEPEIKFPLTFADTTYTKIPATGTDDLTGATVVIASGSLINHTASDITCGVYTAIYTEDGKLVTVKLSAEVTVPANNQSATWTNMLNNFGSVPEGAVIKNFVWDANMNPLAEVQVK